VEVRREYSGISPLRLKRLILKSYYRSGRLERPDRY
jgi:hypothetical protein